MVGSIIIDVDVDDEAQAYEAALASDAVREFDEIAISAARAFCDSIPRIKLFTHVGVETEKLTLLVNTQPLDEAADG